MDEWLAALSRDEPDRRPARVASGETRWSRRSPTSATGAGCPGSARAAGCSSGLRWPTCERGESGADALLLGTFGALCGVTVLLVWVWWVHGKGGPRVMTRELAVYVGIYGLVGLFVSVAWGLALVAAGLASGARRRFRRGGRSTIPP